MEPRKSISKLFRRFSSKHDGDFYCLGCLHSYRTKRTLKKHERLCKNHDYCKVTMPNDKNNILQYQSGTKSLKMPYIMIADTEALLKKHYSCSNNLEKSYTEKQTTYEACGYALNVENLYGTNKHTYYRGKDCIQKFCKELLNKSREIVNAGKKRNDIVNK